MWLVSSMTADPNADIPLQTAYVEQGLFLDEVSASGKLKPISSVIATPEVEGIVGEVYVSEGDIVTEGQVLYTIVNDELDKAITLAQQGINEAYNAVVQAQIAVDDAYYAKQLGSSYVPEEGEQPFDTRQADSSIRQAELSLSSAWTAYSNAEAEYNDAVARAEKRTVLSPITGSVVAVNIEPGKNLMSSGGSSVTTPVQIADLSSMLVSVEVNEVDILKISADQTAQLTFSAIPDLVQTGKVIRIATVNTGGSEGMDMGMSGTVTYTVDIIIEEPDPRLKPGMTAKASIESQRIENVLMVPISAVTLLSETEGLVYVMNADDPDNPEERSVEILASNGLTMAVKGKISAGDELIAGGDMGMMEMDMSSGGTVVMSDSSGQVIVE